jgi:putative FmdB family regulatory protein
MPLYEYECESCGGRFEVIQKFSDAPVQTCKTCGGKVQRLLSAPAIHFKGTGWYVTDYAKKGNGSDKPSSSPASAAASSASESSASSKPASSDSAAASPSSAPSTSTPSSDKK